MTDQGSGASDRVEWQSPIGPRVWPPCLGESPNPELPPADLADPLHPIVSAEEIGDLLADVGITDNQAEELLDAAIPAIGFLGLGGCTEGPIGGSRLGGRPDVPPGWEWPTTEGYPQGFVAEINLDDLSGFDGASELPDAGHLAFFYAFYPDTLGAGPGPRQSTWSVEWYPPGVELTRASYPEWPDEEIPEVASPTPLQPFALWSLPSSASQMVDRLLDVPNGDDSYDRFDQSYLELIESRLGRRWPQHQLMGHPSGALHDDPAEEPLGAPPIDGEWRHLLQVDSDQEASSMLWGDAGRLFFLVEPDALDEADFASVWLELQN